MALFYKSAEDYLKQIIRIALKLKKEIEKNKYGGAVKFLKIILKIDADLYRNIEKETRSKEMMEQSLLIRSLSEEALKEALEGRYEKLEKVISKIISSGESYLHSEEKFVGYKIEEHNMFSLGKQARFLSDLIEGITTPQAEKMLEISFENGLDVVIGGSSLKNNKIGGDLDVGFKINQRYRHGINSSNIRAIVDVVARKIDNECFKWHQKLRGQRLIRERWIHDKSALRGIPDIDTLEEFFMRCGFRHEPGSAMKDGKPFGPSGYVIFYIGGKIILVKPITRRGIVGKTKFD